MKPRLFRSDATKFDTLGFGALNSTISCIVKEELGVAPTLEMSILMDDPNFVNIEVGNIITALPNKRDQIQAFVIEDITKPINGVVTIYATHIAQHRGKLIPVQPFTASDLDDAFYEIKTNSLEANPFTLVRDPGKANVTATMHPTAPHSFRELLGGVEGSILDTYRGEWGYDNFTITLYNKRGHDNGARVMYGRNMSDFHLEEQFNWDDSVTGVFGYWLGENGAITLSNIQYSQYADLYPYHKTVCVDFSDKFETQPSTLELDTYALSWINGKGLVGASVDVAYEHVNVEGGADVGIGDIVHIYNGVYDFEMESRIVGLEFDVLSEEYTNVSIGDMKTTLNEAISDINGGSMGGGGSSVEPSTTTPKMDGTAAIGTEQKYARGDHVHPTDTSRLSVTDAAATYEKKFPVGSVIMTATNTNPSATYGGTWSLIDKFFSEYNSNNTSLVTAVNCTVSSLIVARSSQNVLLRAQVTTTAALGESTVNLMTIPYSLFGIDGFYSWYGIAWSDDGNGIAMLEGVANSGTQTVTVRCVDVVSKTSGGTIASGSSLYIYIQPMVRQGNMLDTACNKFLWRRTA